MIGFWKKDLFVLRKQMRTYAFILVVYAFLSISGVWGTNLIAVMVSLVTLMCPLTAFAYDQAARWDAYACSLPNGGTGAVAGRYLCTLTIWLGATLLCCALSAALWAVGLLDEGLVELMVGNLASGTVGLLMAAITLPLCYQFGIERGRMLMTLVFVCIFAGMIAAAKLMDGMSPANLNTTAVVTVGVVGFAMLAAAGLYGSYRVSRAIYLKKEW